MIQITMLLTFLFFSRSFSNFSVRYRHSAKVSARNTGVNRMAAGKAIRGEVIQSTSPISAGSRVKA